MCASSYEICSEIGENTDERGSTKAARASASVRLLVRRARFLASPQSAHSAQGWHMGELMPLSRRYQSIKEQILGCKSGCSLYVMCASSY